MKPFSKLRYSKTISEKIKNKIRKIQKNTGSYVKNEAFNAKCLYSIFQDVE